MIDQPLARWRKHPAALLAGIALLTIALAALPFVLTVAQNSACVEQRHEPMHVWMLSRQRPVEPIHLIIQAVCVVVAALRASHFIAHHNHGHPD